ncbi:mitochondrial carrier domain-containing protein, partial [Blastocladiella britannica]
LGGCVGAIVTCPFEVVKTRLQSSHHVQLTRNAFFFAENNKPLTGTASIVRGIYAAEGLGAFWKGLGPTLAGVIPARATYFATYNESKRALTALNDGVESKRVVMGSAIGAGFFTTVLTSPIWLIKTRMQLQSSAPGTGAPPVYRNSVDCLVKVVRNEGVLSLYRGLSASLIGISEGTIQWLLYEELKRA